MNGLASALQAQMQDSIDQYKRASSIQMPPPDGNLASEFYKRLVNWINEYDASLDDAHEVGVRLVTFGQNITIRLNDLGYWNPSLMKFIGTREDDGSPVELIQHVTQISILLTSLKRVDISKPKQPLGFATPESKPDAANEP